MKTIRNLFADKKGATAIEYALIAAGISIVINDDTAHPFTLTDGRVPLVPLAGEIDVIVALTSAVPAGSTVEIQWAVDPFSGEGGETDWQKAASAALISPSTPPVSPTPIRRWRWKPSSGSG